MRIHVVSGNRIKIEIVNIEIAKRAVLGFQPTEERKLGEVRLCPRMRRFTQYASVKYDGLLFMTPNDFLLSILDNTTYRELHCASTLQYFPSKFI